MEDGYRTGLTYFGTVSAEERATAVICFNDLVAIGLMRALRELDIRVPEDVSVVGHDDLDLLGYLPIGLTTIHVPKDAMAAQATDLLIQHIQSRERVTPRKVLVDVELIVRDSTAAQAPLQV
jgi:LacI family transcriptional regulator/LacI family repressor for deo operon, udp, cdd, tsx, nupC, and nupG